MADVKKSAPKAPVAAKTAKAVKVTTAPKKAKKAAAARIRVTQILSTIGFDRKQGLTVEGLGLRRIRHSVELSDTPEIRGMLHKVRHIVKVEGL